MISNTSIKNNLNDDQVKVVFSNQPQILCLAGAGTGKTYSMISRIIRTLNDGVDPRSILVLTFTNAAAFEMQDRFIRMTGLNVTPEFRTFHSFCYSLICRDANIRFKLGYSTIPDVADNVVYNAVKTEALMQTGIKLSQKKLSGNVLLSPKEQVEFQIYSKALNRLLVQRNLITFDQLCYGVCKLFEDNDESIVKYIARYKHIYVDEFQDTDPKQWRFVKSFKSADKFVVGDVMQSIYAFRGASPDIIKSVYMDPEWASYRLTKNYRSTDKICEFANHISHSVNEPSTVDIESDVMGGHVVVHDSKHSIDQCLDQIDLKIGEWALLARTNAEVDEIIERCNERNIQVYHNRQSDALSILRSASDDTYCINWLTSYLNSENYEKFIKWIHNRNRYVLEDAIEYLRLNNFTDILDKYRNVSDIAELLASDASKEAKYIEICYRLNLECNPISDIPEDIVTYLLDNATPISEPNSSIYVGTIHSVKGLEYENVAIFGVDGRSFRLTSEQNINLYYVGATRAKKQLHVFKEGM